MKRDARRCDVRDLLTAGVFAASVAVAGCATVDASGVSDANVIQRIEQSRTPADHEAIAGYYEDQARQAERQARRFQGTRRHYAHYPPGVYYPIGTNAGMLQHYDQLIGSYVQAAKEGHAMAEWHRGLAERAGHQDSKESP